MISQCCQCGKDVVIGDSTAYIQGELTHNVRPVCSRCKEIYRAIHTGTLFMVNADSTPSAVWTSRVHSALTFFIRVIFVVTLFIIAGVELW